ncbi:hypothetical protein [Nitrincola sp. A-D6]|uniref:hypothetical protein n=1 Tax=Nitrincola sp. A-D6 TaxID=1545442 RepID=UPI000AD86236|nr:hypothetical protein [Nitrincola sp. A-D6]
MHSLLKKPLKTLTLMATAITLSTGLIGSVAAADWTPSRAVEFIAPANPGGGWDTLVRTTANVIRTEGLADQNFAAINVPGGGGAVAWAQIARDSGNDHKLFATSLQLYWCLWQELRVLIILILPP